MITNRNNLFVVIVYHLGFHFKSVLLIVFCSHTFRNRRDRRQLTVGCRHSKDLVTTSPWGTKASKHSVSCDSVSHELMCQSCPVWAKFLFWFWFLFCFPGTDLAVLLMGRSWLCHCTSHCTAIGWLSCLHSGNKINPRGQCKLIESG